MFEDDYYTKFNNNQIDVQDGGMFNLFKSKSKEEQEQIKIEKEMKNIKKQAQKKRENIEKEMNKIDKEMKKIDKEINSELNQLFVSKLYTLMQSEFSHKIRAKKWRFDKIDIFINDEFVVSEQYNDLKKYYVGDVIDSNNPTSKKLNDSLLLSDLKAKKRVLTTLEYNNIINKYNNLLMFYNADINTIKNKYFAKMPDYIKDSDKYLEEHISVSDDKDFKSSKARIKDLKSFIKELQDLWKYFPKYNPDLKKSIISLKKDITEPPDLQEEDVVKYETQLDVYLESIQTRKDEYEELQNKHSLLNFKEVKAANTKEAEKAKEAEKEVQAEAAEAAVEKEAEKESEEADLKVKVETEEADLKVKVEAEEVAPKVEEVDAKEKQEQENKVEEVPVEMTNEEVPPTATASSATPTETEAATSQDNLKINIFPNARPSSSGKHKNIPDELTFDTLSEFIKFNKLNSEKSKKTNLIDGVKLIDSCKKVADKYHSQLKSFIDTIPSYGMFPFIDDTEPQSKFLDNDIMYAQKIEFEETARVAIIGDIHSSLHSFVQFILHLVNTGFMNNNFELEYNCYVISLGDLVDRGNYSLEILYLIFTIKCIGKNFDRFIILNGNHENKDRYEIDGTGREIREHFPKNTLNQNIIHSTLLYLPAVLFGKFEGADKHYQFCHGGIDEIYGLTDNKIKDFLENSDPSIEFDFISNPTGKDSYPGIGLLWSDFDNTIQKYQPSDRGAGIEIGVSETQNYLDKNNLVSIISGHQDNISGIACLLPQQQYNDPKWLIDDDTIPYNLHVLQDLYKEYDDVNDGVDLSLAETIGIKSATIKANEFLALVTSSATVVRKLKYNTFLELYPDISEEAAAKAEAKKAAADAEAAEAAAAAEAYAATEEATSEAEEVAAPEEAADADAEVETADAVAADESIIHEVTTYLEEIKQHISEFGNNEIMQTKLPPLLDTLQTLEQDLFIQDFEIDSKNLEQIQQLRKEIAEKLEKLIPNEDGIVQYKFKKIIKFLKTSINNKNEEEIQVGGYYTSESEESIDIDLLTNQYNNITETDIENSLSSFDINDYTDILSEL